MKKGEMLGTMLVIATNAHSGQFDRGGAPYISAPSQSYALPEK